MSNYSIALEAIQQLAKDFYADILNFRKHLHQFPELSFQEHGTTVYIIQQLKQLGLEYTQAYAETGVVAIIKGKNPEKKCIAIRADIDALPIQENSGISYQSQHEGIMHACGHDVHSACVFGAAKILNKLKDQFEGTVKIIFQPGEELLPGGASVMIKNGVLNTPKVNEIYGQHVFTDLPAGMVGFRPGLYMASADEIHPIVRGAGGHGALSKDLKDPIEATNHLLIALRKVIYDNCPEEIPSVIRFGFMEAKGATNVVPNEVRTKGTFRTMDEDWRNKAHQLMGETAQAIATQFGVEIDLGLIKGYPCLVNDEQLTKNAKQLASQYLGAQNVVDLPLRMSSEDFAFYGHEVPGCFYRLGISESFNNLSTSVHTSTFKVSESALETGAGLMAWLIYNQLHQAGEIA